MDPPPSRLFTQRLRTLAALDEAVAGIVASLDAAGTLDDTVIMFTSDNGYLFGEHRLVGKNVPYEEAIRVPLRDAGPEHPGRRAPQADRGHGRPRTHDRRARGRRADACEIDGRSLLGVRRPGPPQRDRGLLHPGRVEGQGRGAGPGRWRGVRTERYTLVRWQGPRFVELYDRAADPVPAHQRRADPAYQRIRRQLTRLLRDRLEDCRGNGCRRPVPELPRPGRRWACFEEAVSRLKASAAPGVGSGRARSWQG